MRGEVWGQASHSAGHNGTSFSQPRWEPYFPAQLSQNIISHFDMSGFLAGTKSQVFVNAPPGRETTFLE